MNIYYKHYDVIIICGTSIIHDMLASLLLCEGKRVFYADKNRHYGGEGRSADQLSDLWKIFRPDQKLPDNLSIYLNHQLFKEGYIDKGVDFIPKLIISNGNLVKIFSKQKIQKQLSLECFDQNLIKFYDQKIIKIPSVENHIQGNELLSENQKINNLKFIEYVVNHDNLKQLQEFNLDLISFRDLVKEFKLDQQSVELLGKAMAFQLNEDYLNQPANSTIEKIKLYFQIEKYKPEEFVFNTVFSKHNHVQGGLETDIEEILFDDKGQVYGIRSDYCKKKEFGGSDQIYAPIIIDDPSYANYKLIKQQNRVNLIGKIIRCICILNHPLPGYDKESLSLMIPSGQTGRKNDISLSRLIRYLYYYMQDCDEQGYYSCVLSTNIGTNDPEQELEAGLKIINPFNSILFINVQ